MRVLIACECSNTVRDAFLFKGHDAYSCDIQRADHPNPNYKRHIRGDVRPLLLEPWDLVIAHPPCTYLCTVSACNWIDGKPAWEQPVAYLIEEAATFFIDCLEANAPKVCVENPRQHYWSKALIGVAHTQEIQPYEHGHPYKKATRLWLKGLPALTPTKIVEPHTNWINGGNTKGNGVTGPGKLRSKTFDGIAWAMAEQWG